MTTTETDSAMKKWSFAGISYADESAWLDGIAKQYIATTPKEYTEDRDRAAAECLDRCFQHIVEGLQIEAEMYGFKPDLAGYVPTYRELSEAFRRHR